MITQSDLERRLTAHYAAEAPPHAPDWLLGSTLDIVAVSNQRRSFRDGPWRLKIGRPSARLAAVAALVLALAAIGIGVGALRNAPTVEPPTPPLTGSFTSQLNGAAISFPAGWTTRAATMPWTTRKEPSFDESFMDVIYDGSLVNPDHLFIGLASQPLAGEDAVAWTTRMTSSEPACLPVEPVLVDAALGFLSPGCQLAAVSVGGRGYLILGYVSDDEPELGAAYNRAWFEQVLATARLDAESATSLLPEPGPGMLKPGTYTLGDRYGKPITFDVPVGWVACSRRPVEQAACILGDVNQAGVTFQVVVNVVTDPCDSELPDPPVGPSVDELVTAISQIPGFESTAPVDISMSGYRGKQFEITAPNESDCGLYTWANSTRINGVGAGEVNELRILDVDGTRLLIAGAIHSEANRSAIEPLMDSIRIGP